MTRRARLDAELVRRGLARSRGEAAELVASGQVRVDGTTANKPASAIAETSNVVVKMNVRTSAYASRGGTKLAGALEAFGDVEVAGRRCLDAGASTGGFTDVLLSAGAAEVVAVDVGYGQLDWRLRNDPRVRVLERTNVRRLTPEAIGGPVELTVADLSFISLRTVLPALTACTTGELILLVKPQFEVGRGQVGGGGVVRDPGLRAQAVLDVATAAADLGLGCAGVVASGLPGPSGNVEYFVRLRAAAARVDPKAVWRAVEAGPQ